VEAPGAKRPAQSLGMVTSARSRLWREENTRNAGPALLGIVGELCSWALKQAHGNLIHPLFDTRLFRSIGIVNAAPTFSLASSARQWRSAGMTPDPGRE
jgi:hypothetical protein